MLGSIAAISLPSVNWIMNILATVTERTREIELSRPGCSTARHHQLVPDETIAVRVRRLVESLWAPDATRVSGHQGTVHNFILTGRPRIADGENLQTWSRESPSELPVASALRQHRHHLRPIPPDPPPAWTPSKPSATNNTPTAHAVGRFSRDRAGFRIGSPAVRCGRLFGLPTTFRSEVGFQDGGVFDKPVFIRLDRSDVPTPRKKISAPAWRRYEFQDRTALSKTPTPWHFGRMCLNDSAPGSLRFLLLSAALPQRAVDQNSNYFGSTGGDCDFSEETGADDGWTVFCEASFMTSLT